jgi:HSP20 family protein
VRGISSGLCSVERRHKMKNEKILSIIVFLLILVVGFQGYYMYKLNSDSNQIVKKELIALPKVDKFVGANPFIEFQQMQKEMDKIFNSMNSNFSTMPEFEDFFKDMNITPSLNIEDFKDRYEVKVNLPGASEKNIKISIKDGVLQVEAKTAKQHESDSSNFIKKEIYEGSFVRSIVLPKDAKSDFKSKFENGVLKITIPKS